MRGDVLYKWLATLPKDEDGDYVGAFELDGRPTTR
jgi:hypothetical protein